MRNNIPTSRGHQACQRNIFYIKRILVKSGFMIFE